jgi:hypothetical protein
LAKDKNPLPGGFFVFKGSRLKKGLSGKEALPAGLGLFKKPLKERPIFLICALPMNG